MTLSRARLKRIERSLRPAKTYLTVAECILEYHLYGHLLPGHEEYPGAATLVRNMMVTVLLRQVLQVHQATPEDWAALGFEGREESSLDVNELAALLNHKLGRPWDTPLNREELKAINEERYLAARPDGDEQASPDKRRPYKPGFPRPIFQGTKRWY